MATVNYYLKGALSDATIEKLKVNKDPKLNDLLNTPRQVFLTASVWGKRIQIYTKRRVSQYEWDKNEQLVDCRRNKVDGIELNDWFIKFKQAIKKRNAFNENEGKITTVIDLKQLLEEITPQNNVKAEVSFEDHFKKFLSDHKTSEGLNFLQKMGQKVKRHF